MNSTKTVLLFCYGTLISDTVYNSVLNNNHNLLQKNKAILHKFIRKCVSGKEYPAIIPNEQSSVVGVIRYIPQEHLEILDQFEGSEYIRILKQIQMDDEFVDAYVYIWADLESKLSEKDWDYDLFLKKDQDSFIKSI